MKDLLKHVPGFRSNIFWKKIIASTYYLVVLTSLIADAGLFLYLFSLPFVIFSFVKIIRTRKTGVPKPAILTLVISLLISSGGFAMIQPSENNKEDNNIAITEDPSLSEDVAKVETINTTETDKPEEPEKEIFNGSRNLKVHYIDVGQGDSIFIELPNGQNALIDGGPGENKHHLIKYLKTLEFQSIDYLVATHPHEDHIGGLPDVIRTFDIGNVYMPNVTHTTNIFEELLKEIQSKDLSIVQTETDTVLLNEPGLVLKALAPDSYTSGNNLNDYSIVLRLDYNDNSFMFTGDGETLTEQYLLADNSDEELKVDVLKVGHHGSDTSTTQPFIEKVKPKYSVITCGKGNSYGHPTPNVIARLGSFNTEIFRTDTDGTIIATADGEKITFIKKGNPIEPNAPPTEPKKEVKKEEVKKEESNKEKAQSETPPPTPAPSKDTNSSSGGNGGNSSTSAATQTGQGEVFITKTGSKYHVRACGRGNFFAASLSEAKSRGLEPCKKCY